MPDQAGHGWAADPTLRRFREAVRLAYGARVERVVLYGSRARGEARTDSDYDLAVFLRGMEDRGADMDRLADIATAILYDGGGVIHALPFRAGEWAERTPLMFEVRTDGVDV